MKKGFLGCLALLLLFNWGCANVSNFTDNALSWVGWRSDYEEEGDSGLIKRTVISPFRYGKPELAPQAKALQLSLEDALRAQPDIKLIDFRELQKASLEFGASELIAEDRYLSGARHMGLNLVIVGEISGMYVDYRLQGWYGFRDNLPQLVMEGQVRMVDAMLGTVHSFRTFQQLLTLDDVQAQAILTGSPPEAEMVSTLIDGIIEENVPLLVDDLENLAWSGTVLEVDGKLALISSGQDAGFQAGQTLALYENTERVLTGGGHSIYPVGRKVGAIVLAEVMENTAWGEVVFDLPEYSEFEGEAPPVYHVQPGQLVRTR